MTDPVDHSNNITPLKKEIFTFESNGKKFIFAADLKKTDDKISSESKFPFENIEIFCLNCQENAPMPQITTEINPVIEVKPNIEVHNGSFSYKTQALIFLAGTIVGVVALKYGPSIAANLGSFVISNLTSNLAATAKDIVSYIGSLNPLAGLTSSVVQVATSITNIATSATNVVAENASGFSASKIAPTASSSNLKASSNKFTPLLKELFKIEPTNLNAENISYPITFSVPSNQALK